MTYNLLLVEDQEHVMNRLTQLLNSELDENFNICWVSNTNELHDINFDSFDVILADLRLDENMPDIKTASEFWKKQEIGNASLIAYTEFDSDYVRQEAPDNPFKYILNKNLDLEFTKQIIKIAKQQQQIKRKHEKACSSCQVDFCTENK